MLSFNFSLITVFETQGLHQNIFRIQISVRYIVPLSIAGLTIYTTLLLIRQFGVFLVSFRMCWIPKDMNLKITVFAVNY